MHKCYDNPKKESNRVQKSEKKMTKRVGSTERVKECQTLREGSTEKVRKCKLVNNPVCNGIHGMKCFEGWDEPRQVYQNIPKSV